MNRLLADLVQLMTLERLELNLFRGQSRDIGSPQVFGGQVLGQALVAASATVEARTVHSLHAYFLVRGDFHAPIVYEVDRARDGRHFSMRRVVAIQHGEPIFNLSASFQSAEAGMEHQVTMPDVPPPESLADLASYAGSLPADASPRLQALLRQPRPFEFRPTATPHFLRQGAQPPHKSVWFRAVERLPDDEVLHHGLLAYASDFNLLDTAPLPHGFFFPSSKLIMASIDHAMWFHRALRIDEWLLYATDSPSASGARGFTRGSIFARDGRLVASTAQEGLMRKVTPP
jgi:acyl-CoA thioesterase-2